jgi:hypothetical protein
VNATPVTQRTMCTKLGWAQIAKPVTTQIRGKTGYSIMIKRHASKSMAPMKKPVAMTATQAAQKGNSKRPATVFPATAVKTYIIGNSVGDAANVTALKASKTSASPDNQRIPYDSAYQTLYRHFVNFGLLDALDHSDNLV